MFYIKSPSMSRTLKSKACSINVKKTLLYKGISDHIRVRTLISILSIQEFLAPSAALPAHLFPIRRRRKRRRGRFFYLICAGEYFVASCQTFGDNANNHLNFLIVLPQLILVSLGASGVLKSL